MQKQSILIAGGSGLIGTALLRHIDLDRYDVYVLSRSKRASLVGINYIQWNPSSQTCALDFAPDHVINLAGAGIADGRWTAARKRELISSRVDSAKTLIGVLGRNNFKPKTYISASAIGYYGDRSDEILTETSVAGVGFMADCCRQWEEANMIGEQCHRSVVLRIGIVLAADGGALPKMLMTKALGVYNYFGDGSQYYAWIHIEDICRMFMFAIENDEVSGTYNAVSPEPMTNKSFMEVTMMALGSQGLLIPVPTFGLRLAMGEMADVVLNSNRVLPVNWQKQSFKFLFPNLTEAIQSIVG
jgi:uncharacterized protein